MIVVVMDFGSKTITTGLPSEFFARTKKAVGTVSMSVKPAPCRIRSILACCSCVVFCSGSAPAAWLQSEGAFWAKTATSIFVLRCEAKYGGLAGRQARVASTRPRLRGHGQADRERRRARHAP